MRSQEDGGLVFISQRMIIVVQPLTNITDYCFSGDSGKKSETSDMHSESEELTDDLKRDLSGFFRAVVTQRRVTTCAVALKQNGVQRL